MIGQPLRPLRGGRIERAENPPKGARGNVRLTYNGKYFWFATEREAESALKMHRQADAVLTQHRGPSPAQGAINEEENT